MIGASMFNRSIRSSSMKSCGTGFIQSIMKYSSTSFATSSTRTGHNNINSLLKVTLVGRPNTGKSTLFNRLTKSRSAIVSNIPGTTRDRREGRGNIAGLEFKVVDTGGFDDRGKVTEDIRQQIEYAVQSSDIVCFLIDARVGVTSLDKEFGKWLRYKLQQAKDKNIDNKNNAKILLLANKVEGAHMSDIVLNTMADAFELGLGEPLMISAAHGDGISDLAVTLIDIAKSKNLDTYIDVKKTKSEIVPVVEGAESSELAIDDKVINVAIMGKPNVGKSTLFNAILGEERVITGPLAGLTRDAVQVEWEYEGRQFKLVDTAGLTRIRTNRELLEGVKEKKQTNIMELVGKDYSEKDVKLPGVREVNVEADPSQYSTQISEFSLISALNALRFTNIVILVVESIQGKFSKIDLQLAEKCFEEGRGLLIAANKYDLVSGKGVAIREFEKQVKDHANEFLNKFGDVAVVATVGTQDEGIQRLLKTAIRVHDNWDRRISTWVLNQWLKELMVTAPIARSGEKAIKIKYMTQVKSRPPTFALFTNVDELPPFFEKFLRGRLLKEFRLTGVPIRFVIRKSQGNPVKLSLLKQGKHTRRGVGLGERKGTVGPNRDVNKFMRNVLDKTTERRKRDTRLARKRTAGNAKNRFK